MSKVKTKKLIHVTQKHINDGISGNAYLCPIALALKDAGFDRVCVTRHMIRVTLEDHSYHVIKIQGKLQDFIDCADNYGQFRTLLGPKPMNFYMPLIRT